MGANEKGGRVTPARPAIERINDWRDPLLIKKGIVSHILNEPITFCEELSAEELDKYYDVAMWIVDNITFAPYKALAKAL